MSVPAAARNNAEWCDVVCRAHGLTTEFRDSVWVSTRRSPPFYPDAVTLTPQATAEDVLAGIETGPGCSVKDSFATLDLSGHGFTVLFTADWIQLDPASSDPGTVPSWVDASGPVDGWDFAAELIQDPAVALLTAPDRSAGVVANRTDVPTPVVGLSNLFGDDPRQAWPAAVATVAARFPGRPMVGYEHGDDLPPALAAGFRAIGPLRVWVTR